ncbi:MAG: hypothetical protein J5I93_17180 [Pirellulaceae bacterium]|nr:hypothetical protein [Pirellulaceae bacterium]
MNATGSTSRLKVAFCGLALLLAAGATGCQVSVGGQTLPSPYYLDDDVQYFPQGTEFKLPREAAAMKAARAEEQLR